MKLKSGIGRSCLHAAAHIKEGKRKKEHSAAVC